MHAHVRAYHSGAAWSGSSPDASAPEGRTPSAAAALTFTPLALAPPPPCASMRAAADDRLVRLRCYLRIGGGAAMWLWGRGASSAVRLWRRASLRLAAAGCTAARYPT